MPRTKGSTNKKTLVPVKDDELVLMAEKTHAEMKEFTNKIEPCGIKFPNEEMNLLVDKLNEVINYINN